MAGEEWQLQVLSGVREGREVILSKEHIALYQALVGDPSWDMDMRREIIDSHKELQAQRDTAVKFLEVANEYLHSAAIRDFLADLTD